MRLLQHISVNPSDSNDGKPTTHVTKINGVKIKIKTSYGPKKYKPIEVHINKP